MRQPSRNWNRHMITTEIDRAHHAATIGGFIGDLQIGGFIGGLQIGGLATASLMTATLFSPTPIPIDDPQNGSVSSIAYHLTANTYGAHADIFAPGRLSANAGKPSITSFYQR